MLHLGEQVTTYEMKVEDWNMGTLILTAGVDGMTVAGIGVAIGMERFLEQLYGDLKSSRYKPSLSRRKLIPKPRQPGKFRALDIPTMRDRVVQ